MGLIKIRDKDIRLAQSQRFRDDALDRSWRGDAEGLLARWNAEARSMGLRIEHKKSLFGLRWSKFSTAFYRVIRLGTTFKSKEPEWQAVTMGHEMFHARQWRGYRPAKFRTRYLFWTRWRWAIEVQAYCESVRVLVALGASNKTIDRYIAARPDVLWNNYALRGLRKKDVYAYTLLALKDAREEAERRLAA